ncbi:thiamine-phosphate kinase [Beijerinckia indica]|uniref:Thiamine-monophosphate kinase n=1 Tax=Beijerinckia indica subsp. indica (strain ATCC 9039 / DSM 1715 / NCIMB 8712) TaxID=395963 RepID=B2ICH5_BEII9|nr:thiamine-phosphate kinase [Beijerinckia indica]ACB93864.1 thiamine-monophosphate kinase [Beijerinckia indica subsp. indica ATCC 9039]
MPRLSEDELIATYFAPLAGPAGLNLRDDAAVLTPLPGQDLVLTKDMLVAGVHFFPDDAPETIARKLLRVNLSDLAAKAALPCGFLLGLALPPDWGTDWLAAFARGLGEDSAQFRFPLLGGDTVKTPGPLTLSLTALGHVPRDTMVPRPGARAGDRLYVTGTIGDAALGLRVRLDAPQDRIWIAALTPAARTDLLNRYLVPEPRLGLAPALRRHARAAMDVSDGFAGDLAKLLGLAHLTVRVPLAAVPLSRAAREALHLEPGLIDTILTGGDDYEILCAVPPGECVGFEESALALGMRVSPIGEAESGDALPHFEAPGTVPRVYPQGSFQHF